MSTDNHFTRRGDQGDASGHDPTADLLSQALHEEAAMVSTDPSALHEIQSRTSDARSPRRSWLYAGVGAAAATAAVIAGVAILSDSPASSSGPAPATQGASTDATPVQRAGMHNAVYDPTADTSHQFTMFYLGARLKDPTQARRLEPETHTITAADSPDRVAAVHEFLTTAPIDPDYATGWPEGVDVSSITEADGVTTVDLTGGVTAAELGTKPLPVPFDPSRENAVQALLRTAGIQGRAAFTFKGKPLDLVLFTDAVVPAASDDAVRAIISIDDLVEGQTVTSPVSVDVSGNVFEGNVNWQLLDDTGANVDDGFVTTSMGEWSAASIKLGDLDAGTYTIRCLEFSPANGKPGNVDDKTFIVQ